MESAGSGDEPGYGQASEGQHDLQRGVSLGIGQGDNPFSGDRWTSDDDSGERGMGDRTPEQQAADLLRDAEAVEGMEPDYDFASAEGGNGSPEHEVNSVPADSGHGNSSMGLYPVRMRLREGARRLLFPGTWVCVMGQ